MSAHNVAELDMKHGPQPHFGDWIHYEPYKFIEIGKDHTMLPEMWVLWYLIKECKRRGYSISVAQSKEYLIHYLHGR